MPSVVPVNDYFMVEIEGNAQGFVDTLNAKEEGIMQGRIVDISESMTFFGFNSFMFDKSLMDKPLLNDIYTHYKKWLGKRAYWPQRTEMGAIIEIEGKQYVFLKMTAIMAIEEI